MSNIHFHVDETDDTHGEYHTHDGIIDIFLQGHFTEFGLYDTIIHELLHQAIEETGTITTEKQDHWLIQRLCF